MVRLVDHEEIRGRQMHRLRTNRAPVQRLNRRDLHVFEWASGKARLDDAVHDAEIV
jgi:hypothetical protein